jgi:putative thioredoxin
VLERVAKESQGAFRLVKVNVDENPGLAAHFGVQGIPSVKAFRNGKVVAEFVGAQPEPSVRKFIKGIAPGEMDRALEEAAGLLAARRWAEAEAAYRRAQAGTPTSPAAVLGLAKSLLAQGKGKDAEHLLKDLPDGPEAAVAEKLKPLAHLLVEAQSIENQADAGKLDTLFYRTGQLVAQGNISEAIDKLLEVLRQDKRYRQGEPRLVMLALFELLGEDDPLTREYRNKLASVLF